MNRIEEISALATYRKAVEKLFHPEMVKTTMAQLSAIIERFPGTHIAMKCRFLKGVIHLVELSLHYLLTQSFSRGIESSKTHSILDLFNRGKRDFSHYHEQNKQILKEKFRLFLDDLNDLIRADTFHSLYFRLQQVRNCPPKNNPLNKLEEISKGTMVSDKELKQLRLDLQDHLLIQTLAKCFDVEYMDDINSLKRYRMNRAIFYHQAMIWLRKFREDQPDPETLSTLLKCCQLIVCLIGDAAHPLRQEAFETWVKYSEARYYPKKLIEEIESQDIEEENTGVSPRQTRGKKRLTMALDDQWTNQPPSKKPIRKKTIFPGKPC